MGADRIRRGGSLARKLLQKASGSSRSVVQEIQRLKIKKVESANLAFARRSGLREGGRRMTSLILHFEL